MEDCDMDMGAAIAMTTAEAAAATAAPVAMHAAIASGSASGRSVQATSSTPMLRQALLQPPVRAARLPMTMYLHFSLIDYFLVESLQLTSPKGVQLCKCVLSPMSSSSSSHLSLVEHKRDT